MRARLTALCIGWTCVNASAQSVLGTIQALHPDPGVAGIAVHCAERNMDLAASTAEMLRGAAGFYAEHFEVRHPFALAVLDKTEWTKVTSIPYGLPFVSGPPYAVVLPATNDHPLFRHVADAIDPSDLPTSPTQYVTELEAIAPGFNRWADKFQLLPSAQDGSNASR
jgi:hypothetical protein